MAKYLSNRQKDLKVGISSYTENNTVLDVTGKVGIGTSNASTSLDINGGLRLRSSLYDINNDVGIANSVLVSVGTGISWINISDINPGIDVRFNNINIGENIVILDFAGTGISSVTANTTGIATVKVDLQSNLDGGAPNTNYGGIEAIDGGLI